MRRYFYLCRPNLLHSFCNESTHKVLEFSCCDLFMIQCHEWCRFAVGKGEMGAGEGEGEEEEGSNRTCITGIGER